MNTHVPLHTHTAMIYQAHGLENTNEICYSATQILKFTWGHKGSQIRKVTFHKINKIRYSKIPNFKLSQRMVLRKAIFFALKKEIQEINAHIGRQPMFAKMLTTYTEGKAVSSKSGAEKTGINMHTQEAKNL